MEQIHLIGVFFASLVGPILVGMLAERVKEGYSLWPFMMAGFCLLFAVGMTMALA